MKIALFTTLAGLGENRRIGEEVVALGHEFDLVDLMEFDFNIKNGELGSDTLDNFEADVVILRGIFSSIKPLGAIIDSLRGRGIKIFDNNFLKHMYSINKIADLVKLSVAGVPVPDTAYTRDFALWSERAEKLGYPLVVKSTRTGKGASVYKVDSEEDLGRFITNIKKEGKEAKNYLLQEFIPYKHDLRVLVIGDDMFAMKRIPGEGEFRANFSLGGSVELFDLDEPGKNLARKAMRAVDMSVGGVDILITNDNRRYILEVNHTAGMLGMEKATGKNITRMYVEHAIKNAK